MNEIIAAAKNGRGKYNAYSRMKQQWTNHVAMLALAAKLPKFINGTGISIQFTWVEPNKRRDKDNIAAAKKFVIDGLVTAGVLTGDEWGLVIGFEDVFDVVGRVNPDVGVGVVVSDLL